MRRFIDAVKVSQMDNPEAGTGQGGNRCTEAVATMIDCTLRIGPKAKAGENPEQIMYDFTGWLNNGARTSHLENAAWIVDWLAKHGNISCTSHLAPTFDVAKQIVNAGHLAIIGVNDYSALKTFDGQDPYKWPENEHAGHVLLLVGYDDNYRGTGPTAIVHDPLRGLVLQPWDYAFSSITGAGFPVLVEVNSTRLPYAYTDPTPAPAARTYTIEEGDSLHEIARRLGLHDWYLQLYTPNQEKLNAVARENGFTDSAGGNRIWPGTVLTY